MGRPVEAKQAFSEVKREIEEQHIANIVTWKSLIIGFFLDIDYTVEFWNSCVPLSPVETWVAKNSELYVRCHLVQTAGP